MNPGRRDDPTVRWLAACGILAPIIDVLITAWLGALNPSYSHARQFISEPGETGRPYAVVFSVWCVLWGLLFAGFAVALARGLGRRKGTWLGPGALLIVAASSIVVGFFPYDPGHTDRTRQPSLAHSQDVLAGPAPRGFGASCQLTSSCAFMT